MRETDAAQGGHYFPENVLSSILRYDTKTTSYKIALLRAINDVVLAFPDVHASGKSIAVPLHTLANYWIAYYWPFVDPLLPIFQGAKAQRNGRLNNDISFRPALVVLRQEWEAVVGISRPSDGFFLVNELRLDRKRTAYPQSLVQAYSLVRSAISKALQMPIRYAGPEGEIWTVFPRPLHYIASDQIMALPNTKSGDLCLILSHDLWDIFRRMSPWVEALCIHEWCLFTERVDQGTGVKVDRGFIYSLLTDRPDNRRPLSWERNYIDILLMQGSNFTCPWTEKVITSKDTYDIDHIVPVSIYPINELWNLVPVDPVFNQHMKRDRLPSLDRLRRAQPHLVHTYGHYLTSSELSTALVADVRARFVSIPVQTSNFAQLTANVVTNYTHELATIRNLTRF